MRGVILAATLALAFPVEAQQYYQDEPEPTLEERIQAETETRVWNNYQRRIAPLIASSGHPRDLALAALLQTVASSVQTGAGPSDDISASVRVAADPTVARWLATAIQSDDVVALALAQNQSDSTLRDQALARWIAAEPDNAAPLFANASPSDSDWLARAAATRRFDVHMYDQLRWIQAAFIRYPLTASERLSVRIEEDLSDKEHATIAANAFANMTGPAFQTVTRACGSQTGGPSSQARPVCVHLAEVLTHHSDTSIGRLIGTGMLRGLARTSQERAEADALRRQLDWQNFEWARISEAQPRQGIPQFVELLRNPAITTEQELIERILHEAGSPLTPPRGWQSPYRQN